ncbi:MAG: hypothetical protein H7338_20650 [Candidatus Sericytochromatia bacterium]|nr:hypothetical protein [Candidatus Sericytochromatia bacterium]
MPTFSRVHVALANAPSGIHRLVLIFSGPQKIQKVLETSPGATPAEVTFELPNGLYSVIVWFTVGSQVYLSNSPVPLHLPEQLSVTVDLAQSHPDDIEGSNL